LTGQWTKINEFGFENTLQINGLPGTTADRNLDSSDRNASNSAESLVSCGNDEDPQLLFRHQTNNQKSAPH
jgi:hypothetical protein